MGLVCQAPLPEPDVADVEEPDVVGATVAVPTVVVVELVVPGEFVDVAGGLPLALEGGVVLDASSAAAGSEVAGVVDDVPLVDEVWSAEPPGTPLPSVGAAAPELSVVPGVVLEGDCVAGSVMWPAGAWFG